MTTNEKDETAIVTAINSQDADAAALILQTALGITTGDVAAQIFPAQPIWAGMTTAQRVDVIGNYLKAEALYAEVQ